MPMTYRVDGERHLVLVALTGIVTLEEIAAVLEGNRGLPLDDRWRELVDVSEMTELAASGTHLQQLAQVATAPRFGRVAIIAPNPLTFGLARMYALSAGAENVQVFHELADAETWLQATAS
jgi:hypothetical protein